MVVETPISSYELHNNLEEHLIFTFIMINPIIIP